jgi:hypothetical protein
MTETPKGNIEDIVERFYNGIMNLSKNASKEYRVINSEIKEDYSSLELGLQILPGMGQRAYVHDKFGEIIKQYHSSGLENVAKDEITTEIYNDFWRGRRMKIKTSKGEIDIRTGSSLGRILGFIFIPFFPFIFKSEYRIKAKFRGFHFKKK